MQRKRQTTLEFSFNEANEMLIKYLQHIEKIQITSATPDFEKGTITVVGHTVENPESTTIPSVDIFKAITGQEKSKRGPRNIVNGGMTKFLKEQFKAGEMIPLDVLYNTITKKGYVVSKTNFRSIWLKANLKDEITEVQPNVFQLTSAYEKSHNRETIVQRV